MNRRRLTTASAFGHASIRGSSMVVMTSIRAVSLSRPYESE